MCLFVCLVWCWIFDCLIVHFCASVHVYAAIWRRLAKSCRSMHPLFHTGYILKAISWDIHVCKNINKLRSDNIETRKLNINWRKFNFDRNRFNIHEKIWKKSFLPPRSSNYFKLVENANVDTIHSFRLSSEEHEPREELKLFGPRSRAYLTFYPRLSDVAWVRYSCDTSFCSTNCNSSVNIRISKLNHVVFHFEWFSIRWWWRLANAFPLWKEKVCNIQ